MMRLLFGRRLHLHIGHIGAPLAEQYDSFEFHPLGIIRYAVAKKVDPFTTPVIVLVEGGPDLIVGLSCNANKDSAFYFALLTWGLLSLGTYC